MINTTIPRSGEKTGNVPFRSGRYFKLNNFWFFTTREGTSVGPYDSMPCAEKGAEDYIHFIKEAGPAAVDFFKVGPRFAS